MKPRKRVWHYLRGNSRSGVPSNYLFVEAATQPDETNATGGVVPHVLRLWTASAVRRRSDQWCGEICSFGKEPAEFWRFLYRRTDARKPLWVIGHGMSQTLISLGFANEVNDLRLFVEVVKSVFDERTGRPASKPWQGLVVLADPPTIIETVVSGARCKVIFVDLQNYFHSTMSDLYESTVGAKLVEPVQEDDDGAWINYLVERLDVTSKTFMSLVDLVKEQDLGNFRFTSASQGWQAFRHRFMKDKVLVHCNEPVLRLERDGYFGGICELYRYGTVPGPIFVVDFRSHYPGVMLNTELPCKLVSYHAGSMSPHLVAYKRELYRVARCRIESETTVYPIRWRCKLIRAVGRFETVLQGVELDAAYESSHIKEVLEIAWYEQTVIFQQFVTELWELRERFKGEGKTVWANLLKLMLNGSAGKWGQKQIKWVDCPGEGLAAPWSTWRQVYAATGEISEYRAIGERVQRKRELGEPVNVADPAGPDGNPIGPCYHDESTDSCPQIAGAITCAGRAKLDAAVAVAGRKNVYYVDTDCLHTNGDGIDNLQRYGLMHGDGPGFLSLVGIFGEAEYLGVKYYRLDHSWTVSGVKPNSVQVKPGIWHQRNFSGWSSWLQTGASSGVTEYWQEIDRSNEIVPGVVNQDGTVTPTEVYQW